MRALIKGFFGGGSLYGYLALVAIGGGLIWGFADHYYDKGKQDCRAKQTEVNNQTETIGDKLGDILEGIEHDHKDTNTNIDQTYQAGLSQLDINEARQEGIRVGKALGRREGIEQERRKSDSCLNTAYADDDRLLIDARSLQFDVFGNSAEGNAANSTDTMPTLAGGKTVPGTTQSNDQNPD